MQNTSKNTIGILGAGSWGNTLAFLLGQNKEIRLWDYNPKRVRKSNKTRRFKKPLPQKYPDNVKITSDLHELFDCEMIINTVPLKGIGGVFSKLKEISLPEDIILVSGSKGIEPNFLQTPTEIIQSFCKNNPIGVISGPNLAKEVIIGKPMVTVASSKDINIAKIIQENTSGPTLRVYTNLDIRGVELCGALKNIIAIAAGCLDGLELGVSAKASLITRGLSEIGEFVSHCGGKTTTILGAAGVGDLVATCSSNLSRNYRVGFYLAKGKDLSQIINTLGEVAEGIDTTHAVFRMCQELNIQLPIVEQVKAVIDRKNTPVEAVLNLMNRPLGSEQRP